MLKLIFQRTRPLFVSNYVGPQHEFLSFLSTRDGFNPQKSQYNHYRLTSPWHDIPLFARPDLIDETIEENATNNEPIFRFVNEIPLGRTEKFEIQTLLPFNPIQQDTDAHGELRHLRYMGNGCPFNYGALPQTWEPYVPDFCASRSLKSDEIKCNVDIQSPSETLQGMNQNQTTCLASRAFHTFAIEGLQGDNDPIDVVEVTSEPLDVGHVYLCRTLGAFGLIDQGEIDWKVIAICNANPQFFATCQSIQDLETLRPGFLHNVLQWFIYYKTVDGKPENQLYQNGRVFGSPFAVDLILASHAAYTCLRKGLTHPSVRVNRGAGAVQPDRKCLWLPIETQFESIL